MYTRRFKGAAFTVLLVLLAGVLTFGPQPALAQGGDSENETDAPVVLTEYSDYQCPACAYFHPIVQKLKEEFGESLQVNYRFFPLNNHQYAALSARAAQAAKNQDKYLEMHNKLFEEQQRWSSSPNPQPIFISYARELELDMEQFRSDLNAAVTQRTVMEEKQQGQDLGVNATPTFFVNGEMLDAPPSTFEAFRQVIQGYLDRAGGQ